MESSNFVHGLAQEALVLWWQIVPSGRGQGQATS